MRACAMLKNSFEFFKIHNNNKKQLDDEKMVRESKISHFILKKLVEKSSTAYALI